MPLGKDVGTNIKELNAAHPDWADARIQAAALSGARDAGNVKVKQPSTINRGGKKKRKGL